MIGKTISHYRTLSKLGEGGMGIVYKAEDSKLRRTVALKFLPQGAEQNRERFLREAQVAASLNHPNLCTIFEIDEEHGFIAMELVEGPSIKEKIAVRPLPLDEALDIAIQACTGLQVAHEKGIVHRDIKPANLMLTAQRQVKIMDFGLAQIGDRTRITKSGSSIGTPAYMSPEQAQGQPTDRRTDLWSMGVVLYEMLAGRVPFPGQTEAACTYAIVHAEPEPLTAVRSGLPKDLDRIIAKALRKDPRDRYQNAEDLAVDLRHLSGQPVAAAGRKRAWKAIIPAAAAVLALAFGVGTWWVRWQSTTQSIGPPVIAVRSFRYISSDRAQEYVSSGISEEVRSQLSRVSSVRVLARSAVDRYQDKDLSRMAAELGATRIVEGTVQIEKQRLRASVELTDAASRQALWAQQYDRTVDDVLALQSELAVRIAEAMRTQISPEEQRRLGKRPTENAAAWDLFLQAGKESPSRSIALLKQAVEIDPKFAKAMARIAYRTAFDPVNGFARAAEAQIWAERAVAADPELPAGYGALAIVHYARGMSSQAKAALLKTIELDPSGGDYADLAEVLTNSGQIEEALHWARIGFERNPRATMSYYHVAIPLLETRDDAAIEKWLSIWRQRSPNFRLPVVEALYKVQHGKVVDALADARRLVASAPANREYASLLADLSLIARAADAEKLNRDYFRGSDEMSFVNLCYLTEPPKVRWAYFARKRGDSARAKLLLQEAEATATNHWQQGVDVVYLPLQMASIRALQSDTNGALEWLQRAYERGWLKAEATRLNPMLESLRSNPRFEGLVRRMQDDVARIRKSSTEVRELFEKSVPALPPLAPPPTNISK